MSNISHCGSHYYTIEILATGRSDIHCRIKESLLIKDLKPSLNENVGSEKLFFTSLLYIFPQTLIGRLFIISFHRCLN